MGPNRRTKLLGIRRGQLAPGFWGWDYDSFGLCSESDMGEV